MKFNDSHIGENIDEIVETIIKLPVQNLEERIKSIKTEINVRQEILDSSISSLRSRELELEEHIRRMKYCLGSEMNRKFILENELTKIKIMKINDSISHFRDVSKLKEKLQSAKEELVIEAEKRKLAF